MVALPDPPKMVKLYLFLLSLFTIMKNCSKGEISMISGRVSFSGVPSVPSDVVIVKNGPQPSKSLSMRSLYSSSSLQARNAISHPDVRNKSVEASLTESRYKWWESQEINLGSSINIFNESDVKKSKEKEVEVTEVTQEKKTAMQRLVAFFDLTLLKDPIFVNMLFGMSIAACVETNFSLLFPIILKDMLKFDTSDIAKLMAVVGLSDTMFRLVAPFIGEWSRKPPRVVYTVALLLIILIRTGKIFLSTYIILSVKSRIAISVVQTLFSLDLS